jgi:hypothetical protein
MPAEEKRPRFGLRMLAEVTHMLQLAANSLKEHGPSEWGVTPAQHSDLMA